jgi:hypothetical protein
MPRPCRWCAPHRNCRPGHCIGSTMWTSLIVKNMLGPRPILRPRSAANKVSCISEGTTNQSAISRIALHGDHTHLAWAPRLLDPPMPLLGAGTLLPLPPHVSSLRAAHGSLLPSTIPSHMDANSWIGWRVEAGTSDRPAGGRSGTRSEAQAPVGRVLAPRVGRQRLDDTGGGGDVIWFGVLDPF